MQVNQNGETYISIYEGKLSPGILSKSLAKIKASFPGLTPEYLTVLSDFIIENKFSDERLIEAVNNVISNCIYPIPTIATFIGYDKKVRLYTYDEMLEKVNTVGSGVWSNYDKKKIDNKVYWYKKNDEI